MEEEIEQAEHIPNYLNAEAFITARLKELAALTNAIGEIMVFKSSTALFL